MQIIGPHFRLNESEVCGGWGRAAVALISAPGDSDEPSSLRTRAPGLCTFLSRKNPSTCAPDFSLSPTQGNGPIKLVFHIPILPPLDHSHRHTNVLLFLPFLPPVTTQFSIPLCSKNPKREAVTYWLYFFSILFNLLQPGFHPLNSNGTGLVKVTSDCTLVILSPQLTYKEHVTWLLFPP